MSSIDTTVYVHQAFFDTRTGIVENKILQNFFGIDFLNRMALT